MFEKQREDQSTACQPDSSHKERSSVYCSSARLSLHRGQQPQTIHALEEDAEKKMLMMLENEKLH